MPGQHANEEEFRDMRVPELIDAWEEPMPDATREVLLAELERRNYRIKSLPDPPASEAESEARPYSPGEKDAHMVTHGLLTLPFVAVIQTFSLLWFFFRGGAVYASTMKDLESKPDFEIVEFGGAFVRADEARFLAGVERYGTLGVSILVVAFLVGLYVIGRKRPIVALSVALFLFIGDFVFGALFAPDVVARGSVTRAVMLMFLAFGLAAAVRCHRREASTQVDISSESWS